MVRLQPLYRACLLHKMLQTGLQLMKAIIGTKTLHRKVITRLWHSLNISININPLSNNELRNSVPNNMLRISVPNSNELPNSAPLSNVLNSKGSHSSVPNSSERNNMPLNSVPSSNELPISAPSNNMHTSKERSINSMHISSP